MRRKRGGPQDLTPEQYHLRIVIFPVFRNDRSIADSHSDGWNPQGDYASEAVEKTIGFGYSFVILFLFLENTI